MGRSYVTGGNRLSGTISLVLNGGREMGTSNSTGGLGRTVRESQSDVIGAILPYF